MGAGLLAVGACGGAPGAPPTGGGSSSGPCLPVSRLELAGLEHGAEWEPLVVLQPDGTISDLRKGSAVTVGRLADDQLFGGAGVSWMTCTPERTLVERGVPSQAHFDARDALVDSDGSVLRVDDDGAVRYTTRAGDPTAGDDGGATLRVLGVTPEARRTAEVLVFVALASADWSFR